MTAPTSIRASMRWANKDWHTTPVRVTTRSDDGRKVSIHAGGTILKLKATQARELADKIHDTLEG